MGDLNKLFASGQLGGGQPASGDDKPAALIDAVGGLLGINPRAAKGIDNLNATSITGKDLFKAPEEGGQAILSLSSKPMGQPKNWVEKILAAAANELGIGKPKTDGSSGGGSGSSGGGGSTSTASAPVSSGGGAAGGGGSTATASSGGGTGGSSFRGGSSDGSLETAIASARGVVDLAAMNANLVGPAVQVHMDHTPTAAPPTPAVAVADDGMGRFG